MPAHDPPGASDDAPGTRHWADTSPAAQRHRQELLDEVQALRAACLVAEGRSGALNTFLFAYDDVMHRCPEHARDDVRAAFHALAQSLKLLDVTPVPRGRRR